jgi:hypothetical protein
VANIPSIEKTDDLIFRSKIPKGTPPNEPTDPHLLVFEIFVEPVGPFHSVDVTPFRDGARAPDIGFWGFDHILPARCSCAYLRFKFYDRAHCTTEHDYLLTVILRYLTANDEQFQRERRRG